MSNHYWRSNALLRDKGDKLARQQEKEKEEKEKASDRFVLDGVRVQTKINHLCKTGLGAYNHRAEIYKKPELTAVQRQYLEKAHSQGYLKDDYAPQVVQKSVKNVSEPRFNFGLDEGYDSPKSVEEYVYKNLPRVATREQLQRSVASSGYGSPAYTPRTSTTATPSKLRTQSCCDDSRSESEKSDAAKESFRPVSRRSSMRSLEELEAPPRNKLNDSVTSQYSFRTSKKATSTGEYECY